MFDTNDTSGLYWLQTQQTPNIGTDVGMIFPRTLDRDLRMYFTAIINTVKNTPSYLEKANIISGDFMTEDFFKVKQILLLNLAKNNVAEERREEFEERLKKCI